jgi:hypothetical protein
MHYRINTLSPIGQILFGLDAECASDTSEKKAGAPPLDPAGQGPDPLLK